ncbi:hypothetical protein A2867_02090 [Candidatus Daviesbacteria bacterium RIFCSPHIGHO2_01_FULL_40_11]|uniref:DUF2283 domain-containing protein n=1 Tax=Candidatus Daviesbacteria bacterium RIFCSPHIGHO2_01_FULL_40_11 TaxID=1797762 RepID=A0A1F5JLZ3_9BACT|nr:MAG: hypothetical protein A2867_02090 [Candidatus Daviesbacteria bacterium RIFCSPHIGHO2_01_FULL_40_11]
MKITYDKKIDAMYIKLRTGRYDHSKKVTDDILIDISKKGEVLGLEILEASKNIGKVKREKVAIDFAGA